MTPPATGGREPGPVGVFLDANVWVNAVLRRAEQEGRPGAGGPGRRVAAAEARDLGLVARALAGEGVVVHTSEWVLDCVRGTVIDKYGWTEQAAEVVAEDIRISVRSNGGTVLGPTDPGDLFWPGDLSRDDANVLTGAVATRCGFLVTEDVGFLRAAAVTCALEGRLYAFPSPRSDQVLAGSHPTEFLRSVLQRTEGRGREQPGRTTLWEVREPDRSYATPPRAPAVGTAPPGERRVGPIPGWDDEDLAVRRQLGETARAEEERQGRDAGPFIGQG